ncbi:MAG: Gfo/Idh/MocA family oxidoreductase [Planctomycetota bacterium]|nr:Gfo/Idh/MocA family oxidoreductase [Planctomycetota bacterium]
MTERKRYAVVGAGGRSEMFTNALLGQFKQNGELLAMCDLNQVRLNYHNKRMADRFGIEPLPTYKPEQFETMLREHRIDTVIVTTMDRTHHTYIIRALEAGCDAITEKPMTVDDDKCQQILDAVKRTGRQVRVTFNYRYAPRNSKIKELLMRGVIGDVKSVHFEWLLDTKHGADYFHRWHRDKRNSGGLMVHKATHHFDLVNWWLSSSPVRVFALGELAFYGRENAEQRGMTKFYDRGTGHPNAKDCPFAIDLSSQDRLREMYLEAEKEDGYRRDQSVFGDGISIEDDMSVLVKYASGANMTYHLTAYAPWEGYRIAFNGTKGRLEYEVEEKSYVSGEDKDQNRPDVRDAEAFTVTEPARILIRPHWTEPYKVNVESGGGGHGGGDVRLLHDIFVGDQVDPMGRAADHVQGARSILTGIAANRSFMTGEPVDVTRLVDFTGHDVSLPPSVWPAEADCEPAEAVAAS